MRKTLAKPAYYPYDQIILLYNLIIYDLVTWGKRHDRH